MAKGLGRRHVAAVVAMTLGAMAPTVAAEAKVDRHGGPATTTTAVAGGWVQAACLPTWTDPAAPTHADIVCEMAYDGTWSGEVLEHLHGTIGTDGTFAGTNDYTLWGTADDGTCGTLTFHEDVRTASPPGGAASSVGAIVSGTGDWAGSSGTADVAGSVLGGPGVGGYYGTWTRPTVAHAATTPCTPPAPTTPLP